MERSAYDESATLVEEVGDPHPRVMNKNRLCARCTALDLQSQDFLVSSRSSEGRDRRPKRTGAVRVRLTDILASQGSCSLCDLIARSTTLSDGRPLLEDDDIPQLSNASVSMNWEVDGRRSLAYGSRVSATRRLHLKWNLPRLSDSYLILVAPERYHQPNSDSEGGWAPEALFLGRKIDLEKSNEVLMLSWLNACRMSHRGKCDASERDRLDMCALANSSWFGVIDVLKRCLTSLPANEFPQESGHPMSPGYASSRSHAPFVALSYVWGKGGSSQFVTTRRNVLLRCREGDLNTGWLKLPKTIRDAIKLVNALGYRYLWVDALCIVQDNPRSWKLNANVMDQIYKNAVFTICAADGDNAEAGLVAWDIERRVLSNEHISQCGNVRLMATQLSEDRIQVSEWNSRAWTFQERMLSRRCLVFCQGRVFFQCRSSVMSEDIVAEPQGGGWSLELARAPHQMLHELESRPIAVYMNFVRLYSARSLTRQGDIIAAFKGIGNVLKQATGGELIFGLPASHFDLALLWQATGKTSRRLASSERSDGSHEFPSWSWCGWETASQSVIEYNSSFLEGCLVDIHAFLTLHTWIVYYIRDDQGELRRIWDGCTEDRSTNESWKGYSLMAIRPAPRPTQIVVRRLSYDEHIPYSGYNAPSVAEHSLPPPSEQQPGSYVDEGQEHVPPDQNNEITNFNQMRGTHTSYRQDVIYSRAPSIFNKTYADSPFRVKMAQHPRGASPESPDQPILQFWTYFMNLRLSKSQAEIPTTNTLSRYDILDAAGDWCGSITLDGESEFVKRMAHMDEDIEVPTYDFIAISEARGFTQEECSTWTYYTPKNREQSEWEAYYCLLLEKRNWVYYRVGLGKVFKDAFEEAPWREIILG